MTLPKLTDFPARDHDKLRYGDTDRQGHVNNAAFVTFFETGRLGPLHAAWDFLPPDHSFVIARTAVDFLAEIFWPGQVDIGTGVKSIGRSSITLEQALYQGEKCVGTASSVLVQVDGATRRSSPITDEMREFMAKFLLPEKSSD
jgi:acyl-CoA thioester hydrolase